MDNSIGSDYCEHTIIPQKRDDEIVRQSHEVHEIAEEVRDPVVLCDEWHEQKLKDVEEGPDRQEGSDGDLRQQISAL